MSKKTTQEEALGKFLKNETKKTVYTVDEALAEFFQNETHLDGRMRVIKSRWNKGTPLEAATINEILTKGGFFIVQQALYALKDPDKYTKGKRRR